MCGKTKEEEKEDINNAIASYDFMGEFENLGRTDESWERIRKSIRRMMMVMRHGGDGPEQHNAVNDDESVGVKTSKVSKYVIFPDSKWKVLWDMIVNLSFALSFFLIPCVIGSGGKIFKTVWIAELIFDVFMLLDIFVQFLTAYEDKNSVLITKIP